MSPNQEVNEQVLKEIQDCISQNDVVLFMKGTPDTPMCGFSATVVSILRTLKVPFVGVDVLSNNEIRQGIKQYANWPTIPQLYINGNFIGGCDIVKEMYADGELEALLQVTK